MWITKNSNDKNWFTLVELIIVITILAILATIAFLSFQWYTKDSRNVVRETDINSIHKSLELFSIKSWTYPNPDNSISVTYSWVTIWKQWLFWSDVLSSVNIAKDINDPLNKSKYTYSLLSNLNSFQIWGIYENNGDLWNSIIKWNYTNKAVNIHTWSTCSSIWIPNIVINTSTQVNNVIDLNLNSTYNFMKDKETSSWTPFIIKEFYNKCSILTIWDFDNYLSWLVDLYNQPWFDKINANMSNTEKVALISDIRKSWVIVLESVVNEIKNNSTPSLVGYLFVDTFSDNDNTDLVNHTPDLWTYLNSSSYHISQKLEDSFWKETFVQHFPQKYDTKSFLFKQINNNLTISIEQKDTDFWSIDQILLTACNNTIVPNYAKYSDTWEDLKDKIILDDLRVVDSHEKIIEVSWDIPKNCNEDVILSLKANEYWSKWMLPVSWPEWSDFISVQKDSFDSITNFNIDWLINEIDWLQKSDYSTMLHPGSWHPDAPMYFYFNKKENNLYVSVDISSDNTDDLDKDWIELSFYNDWIKKSFRIDDRNDKYWKCWFWFTSTTYYEHQTCEFNIPISELWNINNKINFSFKYYWTLTISDKSYINNNNLIFGNSFNWIDLGMDLWLSTITWDSLEIEFKLIDLLNIWWTLKIHDTTSNYDYNFIIARNDIDPYNYYLYIEKYNKSAVFATNIIDLKGNITISNNDILKYTINWPTIKIFQNWNQIISFDDPDILISSNSKINFSFNGANIIDDLKIK